MKFKLIPYKYSPLRAIVKIGKKWKPLFPKMLMKRSQDLQKFYYISPKYLSAGSNKKYNDEVLKYFS